MLRRLLPAGKGHAKAQVQAERKTFCLRSRHVGTFGPYDRELDFDDEELSSGVQFYTAHASWRRPWKIAWVVAARKISPGVWFEIKVSCRALFHIGDNMHSTKLVDLPCIIEAQKTIDNRRMFKVADICQMLLVEQRVTSKDVVNNHKSIIIDDFIWPHGITLPLHYFCPNTLSTKFIELDDTDGPQMPGAHYKYGDAGIPDGAADDDEGSEDGKDDGADGHIDEELATELDLELEEDEDDEDLEFAIRKEAEVAGMGDPPIRQRFEDTLQEASRRSRGKDGLEGRNNRDGHAPQGGEPKPDEGDEAVEPEDAVDGLSRFRRSYSMASMVLSFHRWMGPV
ncbi:TAFII55 protein conserved region-domain-containing protein [Lactarius psammicola]|nr:TAFII55 protein conserved region-domain-containing protein [Lactarius psammicola]